MKYSAGLARGKKKSEAMCPCELCREAAGKWCLSVSEDLSLSRWVFRVKIRFLLQASSPRLIKANIYLHALAIDCVCVAEWSDVVLV